MIHARITLPHLNDERFTDNPLNCIYEIKATAADISSGVPNSANNTLSPVATGSIKNL